MSQKMTRIPPELGMLLAALGIAKQISIDIDPDSPLSENEQVQAALDKAAAKHREECAGCREEYEQNQVAAATSNTDKDRRQGRADRRGNKQPVGNAGRAAREFFNASYATEANPNSDKATGPASPPDRVLLGHIAYVGNVPVLGSFNRDEMAVKQAVIDFTNGVWDASIVVMPVFV